MTENGHHQINWRSRIVRRGTIKASQITPHPQNPRKHPQLQRDAVEGSFDELGQIAPIVINELNGYLVDGEERSWLALAQDGDVDVEAVWVELTEEEHLKALAYFDATGDLATYDAAQLDALLQSVNSDNPSIQQMLAGLAESAGLYQDAPVVEAPDAQIDRAEELQQVWNVQRGQLWIIPSKSGKGEHRLLCGDSTNADDVARVMAGERAQMMFTDPPYGVDYTGGHFHSGDVNIKRERDRLSGDGDAVLYHDFLPVVMPMVDGPCYMWFASSKSRDVYNALHDSKCEVHALIIWNKINATYAAMNAQYKQRHEPCVYFKPKGSTLRWVGASDECTVWDIKRDGQNEFHPTQKPVELAFRAIKNHDATTVLDCFAGSGFVFAACEQTGRQGRGLEIEPKYCAVILQRMADMGLQPQLAEQP